MSQGTQSQDGVATAAPAESCAREVIIVGAGPIGIEMATALQRAGVSYVLLEAGALASTIAWWPPETPFFSTSERVAIAGVPIQNAHQGRITGEEYLAYLRMVVELHDLDLRVYEPVTSFSRTADGLHELRTRPISGGERVWRAPRVVLACGDMAAPRMLGIPGEDLPHVTHYLEDPHRYFRTRLLIVGGRNSAAEAALRCWRAGARVTLSHRAASMRDRRVKPHLLPDLEAQFEHGNIAYHPSTVPVSIEPGRAWLAPVAVGGGAAPDGPRREVEADFVLLATGFVADPTLFLQAGVSMAGEQDAPVHDPETMETDVPGVYVAGTAVAGTQLRYRLFIENSHEHVGRITMAITGRWPERLGTISARSYDLPFSQIEAN